MVKQSYLIAGLVIFVMVYLFMSQNKLPKTTLANQDINLKPTEDIDFNADLQQVANIIKYDSKSTVEIIKKTAEFTANRVKYKPDISVAYCYAEKASDVLDTGEGDCVSMSKLNVALLRLNNIPARTIGGCLKTSVSCGPMFAVTEEASIPKPNITILDFKKRGFLHEWVEVWDDNDWIYIESTTGRVYDTDCQKYMFYSYDSTPTDRCVVNNLTFYNQCVEA